MVLANLIKVRKSVKEHLIVLNKYGGIFVSLELGLKGRRKIYRILNVGNCYKEEP